MVSLHVPFKRPLYPPDSGKPSTPGEDVQAVKRAVSRAGYWPWAEFDQQYSNGFSHGRKDPNGPQGVITKRWGGVAGLQRRLGIQATGYWGKATHEASLKMRVPQGLPHEGEFIWDQAAINQYTGYADMTAAEEIVADIFTWWDKLVANESLWHYSQQRPIQPLRDREDPPKPPGYLDCSGTFIYCAWLAGAMSPDPRFNYSGYGNTGSLADGGFAITQAQLSKYVKDHYVAAFYGSAWWATSHICAVKSATEVYSMGNEHAPEKKDSYKWSSPPFLGLRAYRVI